MTNEKYGSAAMLQLRLLLFVRHAIVALFIGDFLRPYSEETGDRQADDLAIDRVLASDVDVFLTDTSAEQKWEGMSFSEV